MGDESNVSSISFLGMNMLMSICLKPQLSVQIFLRS